jgi:putative SOS response-associated peptidase YedK
VNRAAYRTDREQFAQELKEERLLVPQEQFNEWFDTTTEAKPEE